MSEPVRTVSNMPDAPAESADRHLSPSPRASKLRAMRWLAARGIVATGGFPLTLLLSSAALTMGLAYQAMSLASSHRELAQAVLRDYADFAAEEFMRRASSSIGDYGFANALRGIVDAEATSGGALPSREAIAQALPVRYRATADVVQGVFRLYDRENRIEADGVDLSRGVEKQLLKNAPTSDEGLPVFHLVPLDDDGRLRLFVVSSGHATVDERHRIGFEARLDRVVFWLSEYVLGEALLPRSLVERGATEESMTVVVRTHTGHVLFSSHPHHSLATPLVVRDMGEQERTGALQGLSVELAMAPSAAERLIIGGLPSSRLGWLIGLFILCTSLTFAAFFQFRREQRHAFARQDFIARASHELRTPIARIRMFSETLLLDRVRDDNERRSTVRALNRAAYALSQLVDNVLLFSKRASKRPVHDTDSPTEPVEAGCLAREIIEEFQASLGLAQPITLAAAPGTMTGVNVGAFRQILLNLLDNARKYGGAGAPVQVEVAVGQKHVRIQVDDSGQGVPASEREQVWKPYFRLMRDRGSALSGTGIGLAVVRDLTSAHGGHCWVEDAPSGGARFIVQIPLGSEQSVEVALR